jgi:hypothetical protein
MFDKIKASVSRRKKAMNPEDEAVPMSNERQDYIDEQTRKKEDKAPTTRTEMGKGKLTFKKGGSVRGSGCEQRGKTKGRMI